MGKRLVLNNSPKLVYFSIIFDTKMLNTFIKKKALLLLSVKRAQSKGF